jgi:cation diffusion facilitator family transporter
MSHARVPRDRTTQVRRVLIGLLIANLAVVGAKFIIGSATGSLAVLGDAVHSSVDAVNNVLGLAVMSVAGDAPDERHPYGHTKFETLGALAIVVFLSVGCFELVKGAVARLALGAEPMTVTNLQLAVLAATLGVNAVVTVYESRRGRELQSEILLADAAHTRSDVFITASVIGGLFLSRAGFTAADSIVALIVAGAVAWAGWSIIRQAVPVLVDEHALPAGVIQQTAQQVQGVHSAYQIRSRGTPARRFAEVTIAVDGQATVEAAHRIADAVENRLRENLQLHEVVVHIEPC